MKIDLLPLAGNVYKTNLHCHTKEYDSGAGFTSPLRSMYIEDNIFYADFTPVKSVYLKNSVWHCPHKLSLNDDITHVEFEIDKSWTYIHLEIIDSNGYKRLGNHYFIT